MQQLDYDGIWEFLHNHPFLAIRSTGGSTNADAVFDIEDTRCRRVYQIKTLAEVQTLHSTLICGPQCLHSWYERYRSISPDSNPAYEMCANCGEVRRIVTGDAPARANIP